jgi:nucleoside-diphosphate-sugar epimerase
MRTLVTGASGFVGSALCKALSQAGHEVVGLTRDPELAARRSGVGARFVRGSVGDPNEVAEAAKGCQLAFHSAGLRPFQAPADVLRWVHVAGTENVLNALRHVRVQKLVHVSCADVTLHDGDRMHWDEQRALPERPVGAHARTKLVAEELALATSDERLGVVALRPAFLWGAGDIDGVAALARETEGAGFLLYAGGRNLVATTHITNLVRAALSAATRDEALGHAYYITDAEFQEAREFYGKLLSTLGLKPPRTGGHLGVTLARSRVRSLFGDRTGAAEARALSRARSALFDISRATKDLGYESGISIDGALAEISTWLSTEGGLDAVLKKARPLPNAGDVAEQMRAAGGE